MQRPARDKAMRDQSASPSGLAKLSLEPLGIFINEFAQRLRADTQKWEPLVKASGFTGE
jgi:hypothetical protein